ncbi:hypothetical protein DL767_000128 [Monosporascus sp. MG133]|nr:hypothetical protein DL767_000128 [Monosporascus sp. MG133]
MPSLRADTPSGVPDCETIEYLLGKRNKTNKQTRQVKTLAELSFEERLKTDLVRLGKRTTKINGDPFGMLAVWAGNLEILPPLFEQLKARKVQESTEVQQLKTLLESVATGSVLDTAKRFADHGEYSLIEGSSEEATVRFSMGSWNIRIMQCHDLDKDDPATYKNSKRAKSSEERLSVLFPEPPMPTRLQRYLMAQEMESADSSLPYDEKPRDRYLRQLRASAQERYWTQLSRWEREAVNRDSLAPRKSLAPYMEALEANWPQSWDNGRFDRDYFRQFVRDNAAAEKLWPLVDEDVVLVIDCKRRMIFASVEGLAQTLLGQDVADLTARILDLWSFFVPLPMPESKRHVVDDYIRKIHPELDMSRAKVEDLPKAKMAVAHYGCWASAGDRNGRRIRRTRDTKLGRLIRSDDGDDVLDLIPDFYEAAFGTAAKIIRFLLEALDPDHYRECREVFDNLPANRRMGLGDEVENFLSLFALGINPRTQRHRDTNDIAGGVAGLVTLGDYVDYWGPRYFMVGTNHESCKRFAFRKLGRLPPLDGDDGSGDEDAEVEDNDDPDKTCVNEADDEDEEDLELSNKEIHGAGAIPSTSSSAGAEPEAESSRKTEESTTKA